MIFIWLGALVTIGGLLYLVKQAIWRGPLSGPARRRPIGDATIEPRLPRTGLFQLRGYWPGLVMIGLGAVLMIAGTAF